MIIVTTQSELDAAIAAGDNDIRIYSPADTWLTVTGNARVTACNSAQVWAYNSAHVKACDTAHVKAFNAAQVWAYNSAHVKAYNSAHVKACDSAHVKACDTAHVKACDSAQVWAHGSAHVKAYNSARVTAYNSARVTAYNSARVSACDSARVEAHSSARVWAHDTAHIWAYDTTHVKAYDTTHVKACGTAHVRAYDSAHVSAERYAAVHRHSDNATITGGTVIDMTTVDLSDPHTWCDLYGVRVDDDGVAYLYKAVNDRYTTDRGVDYSPGTLPHADDWQPTTACGHGLHFGATPALSAAYYPQATRYVRAGVRVDELVPLDDKVKAPRVVVPCVEVDAWGDPIERKENR